MARSVVPGCLLVGCDRLVMQVTRLVLLLCVTSSIAPASLLDTRAIITNTILHGDASAVLGANATVPTAWPQVGTPVVGSVTTCNVSGTPALITLGGGSFIHVVSLPMTDAPVRRINVAASGTQPSGPLTSVACANGIAFAVASDALYAVDLLLDNATVLVRSQNATLTAPVASLSAVAATSDGAHVFAVAEAANRLWYIDVTAGAIYDFLGTGASQSLDGAAKGTNPLLPVPAALVRAPRHATITPTAVYFTEGSGSYRLRRVSRSTPFTVVTLAGDGFSDRVDGNTATARFNDPTALTVMPPGYGGSASTMIVVCDGSATRLVEIGSTSTVTTYAGALLGPGTRDGQLLAQFGGRMSGAAVLSRSTVLLSDDSNVMLRAQHAFVAVASLAPHADGPEARTKAVDPLVTRFVGAVAVVRDDNGTLVIGDRSVDGVQLVRGSVVEELRMPARCDVNDVAVLDGTAYVVCGSHVVFSVNIVTGNIALFCGRHESAAYLDSLCTSAQFKRPTALLANESAMSLLVVDRDNRMLRLVDVVSRKVTTLAGNGTDAVTDGPLLESSFRAPASAAWGANGVYVLEASGSSAGGSLRFVDLATKTVRTVFTSPLTATSPREDGYGPAASLGERVRSLTAVTETLLLFVEGDRTLRRIVVESDRQAYVDTWGSHVPALANVTAVTATSSSTRMLTIDATSGQVNDVFLRDDWAPAADAETRRLEVFAAPGEAEAAGPPRLRGLFAPRHATLGHVVACPGTATLYVVDGDALWRVSAARRVDRIPLNATVGGVACDAAGALFAVLPHVHSVVRIESDWDSPTPRVSDFAGVYNISGHTAPFLLEPSGVASDHRGAFLVVSEPRSHRILSIGTRTGAHLVLAGVRGEPGLTDGNFTVAKFFEPGAVAADAMRAIVYVVDAKTLIRAVHHRAESVVTIAGQFSSTETVDGLGRSATFVGASALVLDAAGTSLYVVCPCALRRVDATLSAPLVATLSQRTCSAATAPPDTALAAAAWTFLTGAAITDTGDLVAADGQRLVVFRRSAGTNASVSLTARWGGNECGRTDTMGGATALLGRISALAFDTTRRVVYTLDNHRSLRALHSDGGVATVIPSDGKLAPSAAGMAYDAATDAVFVANTAHNNMVRVQLERGRFAVDILSGPRSAPFLGGDAVGDPSITRWIEPVAVIVAAIDLLVVERGGCRLRMITRAGFSRVYAGSSLCSHRDGLLSDALFAFPRGVTVHAGIAYIAQSACVRRVDDAAQQVTTIAGSCTLPATFLADGPATYGQFVDVCGIATAPSADGTTLVVADAGAVRTVDLVTGVVRSILGSDVPAVATISGGALSARLNASADLLRVGDATLVATSDCRVAVFEALPGARFDLASMDGSTPSVTHMHTHSDTSSRSVSATRSRSRSLSDVPTPSPSHRRTPTTSPEVSATPSLSTDPNVRLSVAPLVVEQAALADVGSATAARRLVCVVRGTRFDASNVTVQPAHKELFRQHLSLEYSSSPPATAPLPPMSVVLMNFTHVQLELQAQTDFFSPSTESIVLRFLPAAFVVRPPRALQVEVLIDVTRRSTVPVGVQQGAQGAAALGSALSGPAAFNAGAAATASRGLLLDRVEACQLALGQPLPLQEHPIGIALGDGPTRYHQAAAILNPAILLALLALHLIAADYVRYYSGITWRTAAARVSCPSALFIAVMFFIQPSVTSAIITVVDGTDAGWRIAAGVVLGAWVGLAGVVMMYFGVAFNARYETDAAVGATSGFCVAAFIGSGGWGPSTHDINGPKMYAALFAPYRAQREWFTIVELFVSFGIAWAGSRIQGDGDCAEMGITLCAVLGFYFLALVILRPFASPFNTVAFLVIVGLQFAASVLVMIPQATKHPEHKHLSAKGAVVAVASLYAVGAYSVVALLVALVDVLRRRAKNQAAERVAQHEAVLLPPAPLEASFVKDIPHAAHNTAQRSPQRAPHTRRHGSWGEMAQRDHSDDGWEQDRRPTAAAARDDVPSSEDDEFLDDALQRMHRAKQRRERLARRAARSRQTPQRAARNPLRAGPAAETPAEARRLKSMYDML